MVCPRCAANQSDDIKFCTSCGANLQAVREALEVRDPGKKFDWNNTWLAEMLMSGQAAQLHKAELERQMGLTPEMKRYNEIKAGVIVSSVGVAVTAFLFVFMQGVAAQAAPHAAEILTRIWVAGLIPFMVGIALIVNGVVVSKKIVEAAEREHKILEEGAETRGLHPADTNEFIPSNFSVTDGTTRHLEAADRKINQ